MADLDITTAKVVETIALARELDREEAEFDAFVETLTEEEQAGLVAILWIGRGSYGAPDYEDAMNAALTEAPTPTAEYLKDSADLADHLEAGLEALGISASDAEDEL